MNSKQNPKKAEDADEGFGSVNRRTFLKMATTSATVGVPTLSGIYIASQPVVAEVNGEPITDTSHSTGEMHERVIGGEVNSFALNGNTQFTVQWEDMLRGDIIELEMFVKLNQINGVDVTTESGAKMDYASIGKMGVQVPTKSGSKQVRGSDFFKNRSTIDITNHPDIEIEHFNVDLEDSTDYQQIVDFSIKLVGNAPNNSHRFEKVWDYSLTIEAILGFGISFGHAFGVGN